MTQAQKQTNIGPTKDISGTEIQSVFWCAYRNGGPPRWTNLVRAEAQSCPGLHKGDWPHETPGTKEAPCGLTAFVRPPESQFGLLLLLLAWASNHSRTQRARLRHSLEIAS